LRTTRPEEAELRLREIADERQQGASLSLARPPAQRSKADSHLPLAAPAGAVNTITAYKTENDNLRAELASLQQTAFASPRSKAARAESLRVQELEQENATLAARVDELERVRADEQARAEKDAADREKKWEKKLARQVKEAFEAMEKELVELRTDGACTSALCPRSFLRRRR